MKKYLILILICLTFLSCESMYKSWAIEHGYIHKDDIPDIELPKRNPLPHPALPPLDPDNVSVEKLIEQIILLDAAIQKFQILTEIYERENCNLPEGYNNKSYADKTLEELKLEYYKLLGIFKETKTP